jgi:hypothetical protein
MACRKHGVMLLLPHGRGNQGYRNDGERDVLAVIDKTIEEYRVDPNRIYLGGFSMGGGGTLHVAGSFPDRFAGLVPCSCWPYDWDRLKNLRHMPIWLHCGAQENAAQQNREAYEALKNRGMNVRLTIDPKSGHVITFVNFDAVLSWLLEHERRQDPERVSFTTSLQRHSGTYWVSIDEFMAHGRPASIEALISDRRIHVVTENVESFTLHPPKSLITATGPMAVTVNGRTAIPIALPRPVTKPGSTVTDALSFRTVAGSPGTESETRKRAGTSSGPIGDLFARPFALVSGTGTHEQEARVATESIVKHWVDEHLGVLAGTDDRQFGGGKMKTHSLIVVGNPHPDSVAAKAVAQLPVKVTNNKVEIGGIATEGRNLGFCVLGVNPEAGHLYVLWIGGQSSSGIELAPKQLLRENCHIRTDYVVVAAGESDDTIPRYLASGWFGSDWRIAVPREVLETWE